VARRVKVWGRGGRLCLPFREGTPEIAGRLPDVGQLEESCRPTRYKVFRQPVSAGYFSWESFFTKGADEG
jgi:hypothetical protein